MNEIPFFTLARQMNQLETEILPAIKNVIKENAFSGGPFTERFEREFASFIGSSYFVGVSSGSDALLLALRALDVKAGDEVIVPANTFIATPFAVARLGAVPVFADCDRVTWELDPQSVREVMTERTKGIIGVHLYGQLFPVDEILSIAKEHNLFLVEDCAQSQGAKYRGKTAGTFGDFGCFSFYPAKNLGACGECGGISCGRSEWAERLKLMRSQGSREKYYHEELGYNMRMDGMQAAVLSVKLPYLDNWNKRRSEIIDSYRKEIQRPDMIWQGQLEYTEPAWYLAVVCVDDRDDFIKYMKDRKIICGIHYPVPCHLQKAMEELGYSKGDFPNAEWEAQHCVSLPLFPELTDEEQSRVIEICKAY